MLKELHVENLALIQQATIEWEKGFNALTGETGAGKSMVIDAMGLLLGGRAQQEYIRSGSDQCLVQGSFLGPFPVAVVTDLTEAGIACEEELIFSREIQRSAKSVCRINLRSVPLTFYRGIICRLVNIHGQMEHMNILEPWCQLSLLDCYGGEDLAHAAERVSEAYGKWSIAKRAVAEFEKNQTDLAAKSDFLRWQLQEIEKAGLLLGEEDTLK
ncbi:MAG: AAA family ATPase, partial [Clostridiales bacterium]